MKSILETRPIYYKCDETIRGNVFYSFLALILRKELQDRLEAKGYFNVEWEDIIRDLDNLHEIEEVFLGKKFIIREQCRGVSIVKQFKLQGWPDHLQLEMYRIDKLCNWINVVPQNYYSTLNY